MLESTASLARWQAGSLGRALIGAEAEVLGEALGDVFGQELLQVGCWGSGRELLARSRIRRQTVVALCPDSAAGQADLIASPAQLPVAGGSVDAVLLPHSLELEPDPYAVVREADRVLVGEGQLLVLGFRPWSPWGLRAAASSAGYPPGLRRMLSESRLRDWLVLLGYEIVSSRRFLHRLPLERAAGAIAMPGRLLRRGLFNPLPASAYLLKARKRLYTGTPIRPRLRRERLRVIGGLAEPTA
ncbi:MAG: methyltransferase domain-containing protein [Gammaproteobacteria bacterium]|nr:methyltransferase domain-containing protein [Gammaproteobacteria bacterium]